MWEFFRPHTNMHLSSSVCNCSCISLSLSLSLSPSLSYNLSYNLSFSLSYCVCVCVCGLVLFNSSLNLFRKYFLIFFFITVWSSLRYSDLILKFPLLISLLCCTLCCFVFKYIHLYLYIYKASFCFHFSLFCWNFCPATFISLNLLRMKISSIPKNFLKNNWFFFAFKSMEEWYFALIEEVPLPILSFDFPFCRLPLLCGFTLYFVDTLRKIHIKLLIATIQKQNLFDYGKDSWMVVSYFGNAQGATIMIYITYSKTYSQK